MLVTYYVLRGLVCERSGGRVVGSFCGGALTSWQGYIHLDLGLMIVVVAQRIEDLGRCQVGQSGQNLIHA